MIRREHTLDACKTFSELSKLLFYSAPNQLKEQKRQHQSQVNINAVIHLGACGFLSFFCNNLYTFLQPLERNGAQRTAHRRKMKRECNCQMLMRLEKGRGRGEAAERGGTAASL